MITLEYSLVIEATSDPSFFGFYAPDLPGFTGAGTSIEECIEKARLGMDEHEADVVEGAQEATAARRGKNRFAHGGLLPGDRGRFDAPPHLPGRRGLQAKPPTCRRESRRARPYSATFDAVDGLGYSIGGSPPQIRVSGQRSAPFGQTTVPASTRTCSKKARFERTSSKTGPVRKASTSRSTVLPSDRPSLSR